MGANRSLPIYVLFTPAQSVGDQADILLRFNASDWEGASQLWKTYNVMPRSGLATAIVARQPFVGLSTIQTLGVYPLNLTGINLLDEVLVRDNFGNSHRHYIWWWAERGVAARVSMSRSS